MKKTHHATIRSQQRAIRNNQIDLILEHGEGKRKPGNVLEFRFTKKNMNKAQKEALQDRNKKRNKANQDYKQTIQEIEKCKNKAVLVDFNSRKIITVYIVLGKQKPHYPDKYPDLAA